MVKKLGATVAVALLLATSACGGGRPSEDELSTSMQKGVKTNDQTVKLTKEQADCAAKIFVKSDLSDEALQAIADATRRTRSPRRTRLRSRRSRTTWACATGLGGVASKFPRYLGFLAHPGVGMPLEAREEIGKSAGSDR